MYTHIALWIFILNRAHLLFLLIFILAGIFTITFFSLHISGKLNGFEDEDAAKFWGSNAWGRRVKASFIITLISLVIMAASWMPNRALGIVAAKQVDKFIEKNPQSIYDPQKILDVVDKSVARLEQLMSSKTKPSNK